MTAIVVIAYNRIESLKRLLSSLENADYPEGVEVPLVISIDRQADDKNKDVYELAKDFEWHFGDKEVIYHEKNLGLKAHVLSCGDLSLRFGSVILLEDDLYVSPAFYSYAVNAIDFASDKERIGGISLYNHRLNVHVREPFSAVHDPYDNWYFQFASSWGQAVSDKQWKGFKEWLSENDGKDIADENVPLNVSTWSEKSWLKYHIKYLIETDKYFLYPSISYTTNFSDEGTHAKEMVNDLQVPMSGRRGDLLFNFSDISESRSVYDAFFENVVLKKEIREFIKDTEDVELEDDEICIDLYGYKTIPDKVKYALSGKALPKRRVVGFARRLRPIDENVFLKMNGNDFYLYDMNKAAEPPKISMIGKILYNYRAINAKSIIKILKYRIRQKL